MDEPFSALDALLRERLQDHLAQLRRTHSGTIVFVTHDIREAVFLGSHILMLFPKSYGKAPQFFANPAFSFAHGAADRDTALFDETVRQVHHDLMTSGGTK